MGARCSGQLHLPPKSFPTHLPKPCKEWIHWEWIHCLQIRWRLSDVASSGCGGGIPSPNAARSLDALRPASFFPTPSPIYLRPICRAYSGPAKMSRTETANTSTLAVLADYELHHSGDPSPNASQNTTSPSPQQPQQQQQQPANWPTNHRRVPPYRPVNRSLSFEERAAGSNVPEFIFIQSMLHGCWLNAVCSFYTLKM